MDKQNEESSKSQEHSSIESSGLLDLSYIAGYYSLKIGKTKLKEVVTYQLAGTNIFVECKALFYNASKDRWHIYKKKD